MKREEHNDRIVRVVRRACARRGHRDMITEGARVSPGGDAVEWRNPLTELMEAEERGLREAAVDANVTAQRVLDMDTIPAPMASQIRSLVFDYFQDFEAQFLEWVFASGVHPLDVVKRLFCYAKYRRADLLLNMSVRALGEIFNETGATFAARCKALFGETPAGWKKTTSARAAMSDAQRKAQATRANRRGGKNAPKRNHHQP